MSEKLREYAVLGVSRGGRYVVRHKTSGDMFNWRAADATKYSREQLQSIQDEVRSLADLQDDSVVQYRDTILHAPTSTLYVVLEHSTWSTLEEIASECRNSNKYVREGFIWYLLHEMARVCKLVYDYDFKVLKKAISASNVYIEDSGAIKIDCFDLAPNVNNNWDLMQQLGTVLNELCYLRDAENLKVKEFCYSDDLKDIVNFLTDQSNCEMKPDVILYHPTVLSNLESTMGSKKLTDVLVSTDFVENIIDSSKCDSEKALEVRKTNELRSNFSFTVTDSPVYANISPKRMFSISDPDISSAKTSLSPTLAALALELPGFVPRRQTAANNAIACYTEPHQISERTLSNQWLSRLIALREREETLNRRERDLISKEIVGSPNVNVVIIPNEEEKPIAQTVNRGITLPPELIQASDQENQKESKHAWVSRRSHRRSSSVRTRQRRRQSYSYDNMDSSLSADPGDGSVIVTATRFSKENMPRRNIFPEVNTKKVHFNSANPFVESDESVTLTFYELENVDGDGYQVPRGQEYTAKNVAEEISKFKYLDLEKVALEKRAAMEQWSQSSPSKQAKFTVPANPEKKVFHDITNRAGHSLKKTPSKSSINSKASNTSNGTKHSISSIKSHVSSESNKSGTSYQSGASNSSRFSTRLKNADKITESKPALRQSMAPVYDREEVKKPKSLRKSLLPFKTPFKFLSSKS